MDSKGRVSFPARFRSVLEEWDTTGENADRVILAYGLEGNLEVYSIEEWMEFEEQLKELPRFKPEARKLRRFYLARSEECSLDSNGRLLIPQPMRQHAELEREVVWAGVGEKVELWAQGRWEEAMNEALEDPVSIQESMAELGL